MQTRYFRPKSLSWWGGAVMMAAGLVLATLPLHGMERLVATIYNLSPGADPLALIGTGAGIIGIRDAFARGEVKR